MHSPACWKMVHLRIGLHQSLALGREYLRNDSLAIPPQPGPGLDAQCRVSKATHTNRAKHPDSCGWQPDVCTPPTCTKDELNLTGPSLSLTSHHHGESIISIVSTSVAYYRQDSHTLHMAKIFMNAHTQSQNGRRWEARYEGGDDPPRKRPRLSPGDALTSSVLNSRATN